MKKFMLTLLMAGIAVGPMAQTRKEVKGAVIDKYGNPLPGVKVEATGGAEGTVTDADGTFTLEVSRWLKSLTATYPGMKKKKAKLIDYPNQDILITMRQGSNKRWFVNGLYQFDLNKEFGTFGVMVGQLGNWGWYGKIAIDAIHIPEGNTGLTPSISAGLIKRIIEPVYIYAGVGFTQCYTYNWYNSSPTDALLLDFGALAKFGKINMNVGISYGHDSLFYNPEGEERYGLHIGVGYVF